MGVITIVALPPRVLVAGRLQCGAARAGMRRGRGECAELAHLAPRLHDWFHARHAEKRTFFLRGLGRLAGSQCGCRLLFRLGAATHHRETHHTVV